MSKVEEKTEKKNKGGRPTDYCPESVEIVCQLIATNAKGMRQLSKENPEMPGYATIKTWIRKYPEFRALYLQAKELQSHILMDATLDVANRDEEEEDTLLKVNRDKLKIDTYKYNAMKLNVKYYSDRREHNVTVTESNKTVNDTRSNYVRDPNSGKEF